MAICETSKTLYEKYCSKSYTGTFVLHTLFLKLLVLFLYFIVLRNVVFFLFQSTGWCSGAVLCDRLKWHFCFGDDTGLPKVSGKKFAVVLLENTLLWTSLRQRFPQEWRKARSGSSSQCRCLLVTSHGNTSPLPEKKGVWLMSNSSLSPIGKRPFFGCLTLNWGVWWWQWRSVLHVPQGWRTLQGWKKCSSPQHHIATPSLLSWVNEFWISELNFWQHRICFFFFFFFKCMNLFSLFISAKLILSISSLFRRLPRINCGEHRMKSEWQIWIQITVILLNLLAVASGFGFVHLPPLLPVRFVKPKHYYLLIKAIPQMHLLDYNPYSRQNYRDFVIYGKAADPNLANPVIERTATVTNEEAIIDQYTVTHHVTRVRRRGHTYSNYIHNPLGFRKKRDPTRKYARSVFLPDTEKNTCIQ